jgi:transposase InsO family protein
VRTELISGALSNAVAARDPEPGVIFRSDRGCQYTSAAYAALAEGNQVTLSVGLPSGRLTSPAWTTFPRVADSPAIRLLLPAAYCRGAKAAGRAHSHEVVTDRGDHW